MTKPSNNNRRVVVTGLGVVSSLGIGWKPFWKNLLAGKSGISKITSFDTSKYDRHYGGEVKDFDPTQFMSKRRAATIGRSSQMAIAASKLALQDARLNITPQIAKKTGVCIGMTMAEMQLLENFNDFRLANKGLKVYHYFSSIFPSNSVSSNVAIELGLSGYNRAFSTACAAGNYCVGNIYDMIRMGEIDYGMAGGADSFSRVVYTGFDRLFTIAPEKCQPFDKNRQGMIPAEGAGIVVLETLESARKRKAPIYAEVLGYGLSCNASNMTEPAVDGVSKCLERALKLAGVSVENVDYINAHGTGTVENDVAECRAINRIFGKRAAEIPVSSIKSMLGHTMGAASALETVVCCLVLKDGKVPPTINYQDPDPGCAINCVPNKSIEKKVKIAVNNSQAFGGNNACLVLEDYK